MKLVELIPLLLILATGVSYFFEKYKTATILSGTFAIVVTLLAFNSLYHLLPLDIEISTKMATGIWLEAIFSWPLFSLILHKTWRIYKH